MPRALTEREVKQKEKIILNNAFTLFEDRTFKTFRMEDLARSCNMSKGILFKYFTSKETLFIRMLEVEYETFFRELDQNVMNQNEMTKEQFKDDLLMQFELSLNPSLPIMRLLAIKSAILEERITYDQALNHRRKLNDLLIEYSKNVLLQVSGLSLRVMQDILGVEYMLVTGYLNTFLKKGPIEDAVNENDLEMFMMDYKELCISIFKAYLQGV